MSTTTRTRPAWLVPVLVAGAVLLAVVLALTQPWLLFIDEVANEQLPTVAAVEDAEDAEDAEEAADDMVDDDMVDDEMVDEPDDGAVEDDPMSDEPVDEEMDDEESEPTGPTVLASGAFISRAHGTSGDVAIVQLEDGSRVLTIEGLQTDNGPDLFVYLDDTPADGPEAEFDDGVSLGVLRANIGDLVYEIPDQLELDGITSVGIWCDRFSSLFGAADLVWG